LKVGAQGSFGGRLKALREAAGFTQEELATIAGLSVHAVSALERGERRRPHVETVRALSAALDLTGPTRDVLLASARPPAHATAVDELSGVSLPVPLTVLLGREADVQTLRDWLSDPTARLITLIGPGGVGKTRLALELARAIADDGSTRVVFAPLAAIRDRGLAACAIAEALGLADISASDLPRRARAACQGYPTFAGARQSRAGPGRGAARRGSADIGHDASIAAHQPRPAPHTGRAGVCGRTSRPRRGIGGHVACRSRTRPGGAAVRGTRAGRAA
jgi:transcriptional regulator with XRE-family HTH domain